jgi:hypothetical protein
MIKPEQLKQFPKRRLKPEDGISITANLWEEEHNFHRASLKFHRLLSHGPGILKGLEVVASDPPDRSVYIMPGAATDHAGNIIVVDEPIIFDIGNKSDGLMYLLISYGEAAIRQGVDTTEAENARFIQADLTVEAQPDQPDTPYIEVARLIRKDRKSPIYNAKDGHYPQPNEIDLRYRSEIGGSPCQVFTAGSVLLAKSGKADPQKGLHALMKSFNRDDGFCGGYRLAVDQGLSFQEIQPLTLLYCAIDSSTTFKKEDMDAIYHFSQSGGTILFENVAGPGNEMPPDLGKLFDSLAIKVAEPGTGHPVLETPYLFSTPPSGFDATADHVFKVGDGIIYSDAFYAGLWQAQSKQGPPSRDLIRSALEWGVNITMFAIRRRRNTTGE